MNSAISANGPVLTVTGATKTYAVESGMLRRATGHVRALDGVSLSLERGRAVGIVGESGSGKTTLGRVICGLIEPDAGSVLIDGRDLRAYARRELSRKVQMVFQDPFASLNPRLAIGTALFEAAGHLGRRERLKAVADVLGLVGLPENIYPLYPHQFSGGQRQRIALARALIRGPEILVADEPLSSLDLSIQTQLLGLFARLKAQLSLSLVFITHDLAAAGCLCEHLAVMKDGRIVEEGATAGVIASPTETYTKNLLAAVPKV